MLFTIRAQRRLKAGLYQPGERKRYGKSAPSPPPAPDPAAVASAQAGANKDAVEESARVNQINQVSPFGSQSYSGTIGQPDRTLTTTLNPTDAQTLDMQRQLAQSLTGQAQTRAGQIPTGAFDMSGAPKVIDPNATNLQQVQDSVYRRNTQYLDPQFDQQQHDLEAKLANQGIPVGSEAYTRATGDLARQKQQAYSDARDAAVQAGDTAQAQQFSLSQGAHTQGVQDILTQRTEPMNELAALLQGAPALNTPNFAPPAQYQVPGADVTGAYGLSQSAKNAAYQGGVSSAASGNAAGAGLLGTAATAAAIFF